MANRLTGVRLGRHERLLLDSAGSSQGITPLVLDPADAPRSTQQGLLRAALKLEAAGLIERHPVYKERRVRDRRRERPHFHARRLQRACFERGSTRRGSDHAALTRPRGQGGERRGRPSR